MYRVKSCLSSHAPIGVLLASISEHEAAELLQGWAGCASQSQSENTPWSNAAIKGENAA